ncbi:hypothetical protein BDP81DRAFT_423525, partial [Colletotrichum phormii]
MGPFRLLLLLLKIRHIVSHLDIEILQKNLMPAVLTARQLQRRNTPCPAIPFPLRDFSTERRSNAPKSFFIA